MSKFESENWKKAVKKRLDSFERRKEYWLKEEPSAIYKVDGFEWEYITHYIMADEEDFLKKFDVNPKSCKQIDLYWKFDGDVAFVEIVSAEVLETEFTARWRSGILYLTAGVKDKLISSVTVETVLKALWKKHLKENLFHKYY